MVEQGRRRQTSTELPGDLVDEVRPLAKANGVNLSYLWYLWLAQAARLAAQGQGHLLPQVPLYGTQRRIKFGSLGGREHTQHVYWLQSVEEFSYWQGLINNAGSSVPAVLREASQAYVDAGGDVVAMSWPPETDGCEAA